MWKHLAENPRTPRGLLLALWSKDFEEAYPLGWALAQNPNAPREILEEMVRAWERGWLIPMMVSLHPNLGEEGVRRLVPRDPIALGNPGLPEDLLEAYRERVREFPWLLANPKVDPMGVPWWEFPKEERMAAFVAVLHNPRAREPPEEALALMAEVLRDLPTLGGNVLSSPHAPLPLRLLALKLRKPAPSPENMEEILKPLTLPEALALLEGWPTPSPLPRRCAEWLRGEEFWTGWNRGRYYVSLGRVRLRWEGIPNPLALLEGPREARELLLLDPSTPLEVLFLLLGDGNEGIRTLAEEHPVWSLLL